jgi:hypothetical protein
MPNPEANPEATKPEMTHEEKLAMLSPNVLAREMMRQQLVEDGDDGSMADQCYEDWNQ